MENSTILKNKLSEVLIAKSTGDKPKLILWDGLLDKLMELVINLMDSCIGQMTPAKQAEIMVDPNFIQRSRMRASVKKNLYDNSRSKYNQLGGEAVADGFFEACAAAGKGVCEQAVIEMTTGDNYWPNADLFMG